MPSPEGALQATRAGTSCPERHTDQGLEAAPPSGRSWLLNSATRAPRCHLRKRSRWLFRLRRASLVPSGFRSTWGGGYCHSDRRGGACPAAGPLEWLLWKLGDAALSVRWGQSHSPRSVWILPREGLSQGMCIFLM